jgi:hypothetical protein
MTIQDIPLCSWRLGKHSYLCRCAREPHGSNCDCDCGFDSDSYYGSDCGCEICNGYYGAEVMRSGQVIASRDDGGAGVNGNDQSVQ